MASREIVARVRVIYVTLSELLDCNNLWTAVESSNKSKDFTEIFVKDDADYTITGGYVITAVVKGDEVIYHRRGGLTGVHEKSPTLKLELGEQSFEKEAWPELLGADKFSAKKAILLDGVKDVVLLPEGSIVTFEFRTDRVRVFTSKTTDKVAYVPTVG